MDDWVQEEVLTQIDSMRKEIIALKKELKTVGEKLEVHLGDKENIKPTSISINDIETLGDDGADFAIVEFSIFNVPIVRATTAPPKKNK
jgi:hypothetical protein